MFDGVVLNCLSLNDLYNKVARGVDFNDVDFEGG